MPEYPFLNGDSPWPSLTASVEGGQATTTTIPSSSGSFASGFLLGQLTLALILFFFLKFFLFGDPASPTDRAAARAASRQQRTLSHTRPRALSSALRPRPSSAVIKPRLDTGLLAVQQILEKTYYNVHNHQPESLDWFNVLVAQTIAQLRADAAEDEAVLTSLNAVLNGGSKPDFLDEIKVTEISLGEEFPIFSNCRVLPVDENGAPIKELTGNRRERLQARMDVDLSDVVTLGVETKLLLNYPKPLVAVLPVALAVSVVRFSGTLSVSFSPSSSQANPPYTVPDFAPETEKREYRGPGNRAPNGPKNEGHPLNPTGSSPTTLTFTFLDDYRLDLSVSSLIGSRSRLQDIPKLAQLVEARVHAWFDERVVEPRFQQIVMPSLWPRKRNTRGGDSAEGSAVDPSNDGSRRDEPAGFHGPAETPRGKRQASASHAGLAVNEGAAETNGDLTAEQRTRDWAAVHGGRKEMDEMSEIEMAGAEMREGDLRERRKVVRRQQTGLER